MDREELLKLENQLCFTVYAVSRELMRLYRPYLDELGITYTQYVTLLALWEQDDVTVKQLGGRLYLDSGTLTPLLKKMEGLELLERARDPRDERNLRIRLTDKGRSFKELAFAIPEKVFCLTGMKPDEAVWLRKKLAELLQRVQYNEQMEEL
jgi:MarR family transcriptional regulator, organic hydroperoxide resistance regulator